MVKGKPPVRTAEDNRFAWDGRKDVRITKDSKELRDRMAQVVERMSKHPIR